MQKKLTRLFTSLIGAGMLLGALIIPAAAANGITVLVDDQPVQFTDVRPLIRSDRTYVPFRAIFEQMGASVKWHAPSQTITAVRDGLSVQFQVGKAEVSITENGNTQVVRTDAAPFITNSRTYVPVRFASQALGACVDWVQESQSVLIVDIAKQMHAYADSFRILDDYLAFAAAQSAGAVSGKFTLSLRYQTAMGKLPLEMSGTLSGSANAAATELSGSVQTNVSALRAAIEQNEGKPIRDSEIDALLSGLSPASCTAILSRADGKVYLSSPLLTELGVQKDGWAAISFLDGGALQNLRTAIYHGSFARYAAFAAQSLPLKDAPNATVSTVRTFLETLKAAYGDAAFQAQGTDKLLKDSAGREILRLQYSAPGTITRARITSPADADGYRTAVDQSAAGYVLSAAGEKGNVKDLAFTLTLSISPGNAAPRLRPAGEITAFPAP